VRESLFARLGELGGADVADFFAGTGALGIEALSRGATRAVFVERAGASLACLEGNLKRLGLRGQARVLRSDVSAAIRRLERAGSHFHLILMDPPYGPDSATEALREVARCGILAPGGTLVIEASRRHPPGHVEGLRRLDERVHGDTVLVRFEAPSLPGSGSGAELGGTSET
jgi:16S rRNA (guanine(966)-N(2))-methyltransferase RsmD